MSYGNPYQSNPYGQAPQQETGYGYGNVSFLWNVISPSMPAAPPSTVREQKFQRQSYHRNVTEEKLSNTASTLIHWLS